MTLDELDAAMKCHTDAGRPKAIYPDASPTSLCHWFPLIAAAGLPVPRTEIVVPTPEDSYLLCDAVYDAKHDDGAVSRITDLIRAAATRVVGDGRPFFLRTDLTSAKHDWKDTCHVVDWSRVSRHVGGITNYSGCCVDEFPAVWVVRELLATRPLFTAFHGRMPITREFRVFVRDGVVEHVQPYWPADAIGEWDDAGRVDATTFAGDHIDVPVRLPRNPTGPDRDDWRDLLAASHRLDGGDRTCVLALAIAASRAVPGFWSVDLLETADRGWVLTDMAEGAKSYRWEPEARP